MATFDFHFHLLFKHAVAAQANVDENVDVKGFAQLLNTVFGGPFSSQSSPKMVLQSPLRFGVIALLAIEHAFVNDMLRLPGFRLDKALPLDQDMIKQIRDGSTTYNKLFASQLQFTVNTMKAKEGQWKMFLLNRSATDADKQQAVQAIDTALGNANGYNGNRYFALSIEGGHNLSEVPIHREAIHQTPEETLRQLQDGAATDFISINLCHLSFIRELNLGCFAQGLNKNSQKAFNSPDFLPTSGIGLTPAGRKVIKQALTHVKKPVLIDVKHMSLYTRLQYYKYKRKLALDFPAVERLPVISSHSGFTFNSVNEYLNKRQYKPELSTKDGKDITTITPKERFVGKTDDWINKGLHGNPWTINLFDEEILEIYRSGGLIGISLDQRVLGTENMVVDSKRGEFYEAEHLSREEYIRLFQNLQMPEAESLGVLKGIAPTPAERHSMLLSLHLVHAVRVGLAAGIEGLTDDDDSSPWDYLCIGSDFDGLINPIDAVQNVTQLDRLKGELMQYLPQADKTLPFYTAEKALRYNAAGKVDKGHMEAMIDRVLCTNGLRFLKRFLRNWS